MTQAELVATLFEDLGEEVPKEIIERVLKALPGVAVKALKKSGRVVLPGIGKLFVRKYGPKPERKAFDVLTQRMKVISPKPATKGVKIRFLTIFQEELGIFKKGAYPSTKQGEFLVKLDKAIFSSPTPLTQVFLNPEDLKLLRKWKSGRMSYEGDSIKYKDTQAAKSVILWEDPALKRGDLRMGMSL
jgi:nucleoid DNA-binding protein